VDRHDVLFLVAEGRDAWTVFTADGPGRLARVGTIPQSVNSLSTSRDLERAVVNTRDYRADAWMSRVIR
jgi:hypothetical protein